MRAAYRLSSCLSTVPGNLGCFKDSGDPPTLSGPSETSNKLTIQNCISFCRKQRYKVSVSSVQRGVELKKSVTQLELQHHL